MSDRVRHRSWGEGLVTRVEDDLLTVLFDTVGYKTFDAELAEEREILELVGSAETSDHERAS